MLGKPVGFITPTATGVAFPSPSSVGPLIGRERVARILVKHTARRFLGVIAVAAPRHERGKWQPGFGLRE